MDMTAPHPCPLFLRTAHCGSSLKRGRGKRRSARPSGQQQFGERGRRDRWAEQKALDAVASMGTEEIELLLRLDAFVGIPADSADERLIDLQCFDVELP